jgi:acyl dehydratase
MPMDPSFEGRVYPPDPPYLVGREKLREFATAIGATDPIYHDVAAARARGYADVVATPTFPIVISDSYSRAITHDPGLGMDYSRVVHGDQRFAYDRPVVAGDVLICQHTIESITSRGGHQFITTRADLSTPEGERVVRIWVKLVQRGEGRDG